MGIRFLTIREESYRDRKDEDSRIQWYWREKNAWFLTDRKEGRKEGRKERTVTCTGVGMRMCVHTHLTTIPSSNEHT